MVARPGRPQAAFTAGELDPLLHDRTTLKYFSTGLKHAENIIVLAQGGFRLRDGLRYVGPVPVQSERIIPFSASNGAAFDLVMFLSGAHIWAASTKVAEIEIDGIGGKLLQMTTAQQSDTLLLFHEELKTKRVRLTDGGWLVDDLPYRGVPNYDYGGSYTNGVSAKWRLEFVGLETGTTVFTLTLSTQETQSILFSATMATLVASISAAIGDLPNLRPGYSVTSPADGIVEILFSGDGNEGDAWAVSGRVINKADAAILAVKTVVGVSPGEAVISDAKGWPQCGAFYGQALFVGGMKSLPNAWMRSMVGDFFTFEQRFSEANGPMLVPMDVAGGERIERIVPSLNLLIFTTQAEYWIAERAISRTQAPNHVEASRHGTKRGVPVVENEGAAVWCHANGATIGELRYTDVEGNFVGTDISLLASHLLTSVTDQAIRRATDKMDGSAHAIILDDGQMRLVTMLREQEVTGYARMTTKGLGRAVARNGRNELSFIVERDGARSLERLEAGLLLDEAADFVFEAPVTTITGLARFGDRPIWCLAEGDVFGPYTQSGGALQLPRAVSSATVGTWMPPVIQTLPPPRDIGPNVVLKRKARIHTVHLSLMDTTSVAISTNGKPVHDVPLQRYGLPADVPELQQGFTGTIKISGLTGYADDPFVTISQVRPGRLNVRSITVETAL